MIVLGDGTVQEGFEGMMSRRGVLATLVSGGGVYALILGSCEVPSVRESWRTKTALHKIGDMNYGGTRCGMISITTLWHKKKESWNVLVNNS